MERNDSGMDELRRGRGKRGGGGMGRGREDKSEISNE